MRLVAISGFVLVCATLAASPILAAPQSIPLPPPQPVAAPAQTAAPAPENPAPAASSAAADPGPGAIEKVSPSVVMILTGNSAGTLAGVGSGVVLRADGIIITSYHVVKNARHVQVRFANGEVLDTVELANFDARADLAVLRIPAGGLSAIAPAPTDATKPGAPVYVVSHPAGLETSASAGILSGVRLADNVPGAGAGYRLLQFTAPVSPGSSGGALVDPQGRALGIVVGSFEAGQNLNFAVPIDRALGLAASPSLPGNRMGSGVALNPPYARYSRSSDSGADPEPVPPGGLAEILKSTRTICIVAGTFIPSEPLEKSLMQSPAFRTWGFVVVKDQKNADLIIRLDHPIIGWDYTFTIFDRKTRAVIGSGKVIAWDGIRAAPGLAADIINRIEAYHPVAAAAEDQKSKT